MAITIKSWHYYSRDHALAASALSRRCGELEAQKGLSGEAHAEHRAYAATSVISSVCFLEASINEFLCTAGHDELELAGGRGSLSAPERQKVKDVATTVGGLPTLEQFQIVLHILDRPPFSRGEHPFDRTALLIKLRNELVHYRPRWRELDLGQRGGPEQKLVAGLKAQDFPRNALYAEANNAYFPDLCLGHGCTSWAWRTALELADVFFQRTGTEAIYEEVRNRLTP